jgi:hypothetical protein
MTNPTQTTRLRRYWGAKKWALCLSFLFIAISIALGHWGNLLAVFVVAFLAWTNTP